MTDQALSDQYGFLVEGPGQVIGISFDAHALRLSGEIDMTSGEALELVLASAFEPGEPLTVDMSDVPFMDSAGLRAFLAASRTRDITIRNATPRVRIVFEMTGLAETFHLS